MEFIVEIAKLVAKKANLGEEEILSLVQIPPTSEMGDYALPCFVIAKSLNKTPHEAAGILAKDIKADFLKSVTAQGPYINFKIDDEVFASEIIENILKFKKKKQKVMVEFSQPNTHKEFHVGHLRNACLGQSLVNVLRISGKEVVPVNYIGDIGTHVAKTLWCLNNFHKGELIKGNKGKYLGRLYVEANKRIGENEDLKKEVSKLLQELEERKPEITKQWADTREWSLDEFKLIYRDLGIKFDKYYFESEEDIVGKEIALQLLEKGIAEESEGATIVNLEKEKLGVALVLKSDGTTLYLTKDLSLGQKKFSDYDIDESIYVIDARQSLHMKQVFKILELMGFKKKMVHVSYEFVSTSEGPISSRKGNTYLYEDLKERLVKKISSETKKRHSDWDSGKIGEVANTIALSGLKFGMLKIENNREIIFEEDKWLDVEGETGPYILYTYARLNSIMRKAESISGEIDYSTLSNLEDKELLRLIEKEKSTILEAEKNYKPSVIARYLLDICQKSNEYYHKHQVLKEKDEIRNARLKLFDKVMEIIKRDLKLLGIDVLGEM